MQVIYTAKNYTESDAANLKMVLALNEDSCGIALHTAEGQLQYLSHYNFIESLKDNESLFFDFVRSQEVLKQKYNTINIVLDSPKSTLVPNALFNELYTDTYLRHIHTAEKGEVIKANEVIENETKIVFCASEHLYYPARSKYYEATIEPTSVNYLRKSIKHHHNKLNVFLEDSNMYMVHAVNSKPAFFNSFKYEGVDEAAYFILNYFEVFNIPHKSLPIILHGKAHPQLKEILNKYSSKTEFAQPINNKIESSNDIKFPFLIDFTY